MHELVLKELTINTEHRFIRPVAYDQAKLASFCDVLFQSESFRQALDASNVALSGSDGLYQYRLTLTPFNGAAEIVLSSSGAAATFRGVSNVDVLQKVIACIITIETGLQPFQPQERQLSSSMHSRFIPPEEHDKYMGDVALKDRGYTTGGITLRGLGRTFNGHIKFSTDQSMAFDDGLFITCEVKTQECFSKDVLEKIRERIIEVARDSGLNLRSE
jgi:hypothetical protein